MLSSPSYQIGQGCNKALSIVLGNETFRISASSYHKLPIFKVYSTGVTIRCNYDDVINYHEYVIVSNVT